MNFESVRSIIDTYIKKNGVEAITGDILNNVLNTMLDDVDTAISSIEPSPGGGSGEGGVSEKDVLNILEKNNYITSSALSSYYTKAESDNRYLASSLLGSNTLIHSGNIGSYAFVPKSDSLASNVNADNYWSNGVYLNQTGNGSGNSNFPQSYSIFATFAQSVNYLAQLSIGYNSFYFRRKIDTWDEWREVIHSGNIGSQNAGSATKIQTARNIWGQSFDGTGDVYGTFKSNRHHYGLTVQSQGGPWYGAKTYLNWDQGSTMGVCRIGTTYQYDGLVLGFSTGNSYDYNGVENLNYTDMMLIRADGNVGIGTTNPAYKLDVNGSIALQNLYSTGALFMNNGSEGIYVGGSQIHWHNSSNAYAALLINFSATQITIHPNVVMNSNLIVSGDVASA